jgi:hypothetical protein
MKSDEIYRLKEARRRKENVYEQWRKVLTIHVVNEEINREDRDPITVTMEQMRTVFNNGYKFAMHQNMQSLKRSIKVCEGMEKSELLELLAQVKDRLITSDCIERHETDILGLTVDEAFKRRDEFNQFTEDDFCSWGTRTM